ncbi:hypothetical protein TSUD_85390 [Trifolium subterraneum]|uniref:Legume lectin domain-containing protein n=1 Tax=Trifolium subterraneum TaxID=3900 RepID=A0A2Z6PI49_TRISU|nr:hypothetical protein TSUD_85390 [Trifolium subterraneum]
MISVANVTWLADIKEGKLNEAWINYNASSLNLSIIFTGFNNDTSTTVIQHLFSIVDLRLYLPEFVTVGFSAATGNATAIHSISSWDFSSTLESQQDNKKTIIEDPNIAPSSKKKKSKAGLAAGLGIGGFVLIGVFGFISFYLWKKWKKVKEEEDDDFEEYMGEDFGRGGPKKYTYAELAHAANNFKDEHKLGQGGTDVYQDNQVLQLTKYEKDSLGRVTYSKLFHLWDINTNQVTDFTTRFSFTINTPNKTNHGDGITFYLAHPNFPLPVPRDGSGIGLVSPVKLNNINFTKENPFVAVEFDTFVNELDPKYEHVGIDVNSISTSYTTQWFTSMDDDAEVSYNSSSNNLSVTFTGYQDNKMIQQHLSSVVDLREVLPDWVEFGFTSATGLLWGEYHTLNSWSFNSSLDFEAEKDGTKKGLVIGLSVGGVVVLICVIGLVCFVKWKLRNKYTNDVLHSDLAMDSEVLKACDSRLYGEFNEKEIERLMIIGLWCTHMDHVQRPIIRQVVQVLNFDAPLPTLPLQMNGSTYNKSLYSVSSKSKTSTSSNRTFTGTGSSSQSSTAFEVISPSAALLNTF